MEKNIEDTSYKAKNVTLDEEQTNFETEKRNYFIEKQ